jgi:cytoskeletal protein RodZ
METPMNSVNKICMSVLMLGAAAIAVPAMAQSADNQAAASDQAATPSPAAADASTSAQTSSNTQTAMNTSTDAAANADVSSVGDTSKKYHRANRAKDFRAEQKITEQLNQQANAAAKPTQTASNQ